MPAAAQFVWTFGLELFCQSMHGSIPNWPTKPVWLARYNSYKAGARYEVPMVPRMRKLGTICQLKPYFQTWLAEPTEPYLNSRADRSMDNESTPGKPFRIGTPTSPKTSVTWSVPLVSPAVVLPQVAGGGLSSSDVCRYSAPNAALMGPAGRLNSSPFATKLASFCSNTVLPCVHWPTAPIKSFIFEPSMMPGSK